MLQTQVAQHVPITIHYVPTKVISTRIANISDLGNARQQILTQMTQVLQWQQTISQEHIIIARGEFLFHTYQVRST